MSVSEAVDSTMASTRTRTSHRRRLFIEPAVIRPIEQIPKRFGQLQIEDKSSKENKSKVCERKPVAIVRFLADPVSPTHHSKTAAPPPPAAMGCCVSREDSDFRKECLAAHNKYRANHGSPGLVLSSDLNQIAQKWANRLATTNTLKHSSCIQKSIGENLAYKWSSDNQPCDAAETVKEWYDEIEKYNFKDPKGIAGTGHFTQLVWKATKEVGIAKAKGEDGSHYVVANYRPAGNVIGKHKQNVAPPKKKIH